MSVGEERGALLRALGSSSLRQLVQLVAPGQAAAARGRFALSMPRRVAADLGQARRLLDGARSDGAPVRKRLLVFDDKVPDASGDSASHRLTWILRLARSLSYEIALYSVRQGTWFDVSEREGEPAPLEFVARAGGDTTGSVAWVVRPDAAAVVLPALAPSRPRLRVIYDSVDLHHVRFERESAVTGGRGRRLQARVLRELERKAVRRADLAVAITEEEVAPLVALGAAEVAVFPNVHAPRAERPPPLVERSGLLFVGNYSHPPNVDAVEILVHEVMPRLWRSRPQLGLSIAGRAFPAESFPALDPRIAVRGWVDDLERLVDESCLLVAPLRFGAGLKGKVGFALARGLPVVTTPVGAEGFPDPPPMAVAEAGDWGGFAERTLELLERQELWSQQSAAGIELTRREFAPDVLAARLGAILEGA